MNTVVVIAKAKLEIARLDCAYLKDAMHRLEALEMEGAGRDGELRRTTLEWKKAEQQVVIAQAELYDAEEGES